MDKQWEAVGDFRRRHYESYADYVDHQKSKLDKGISWLPGYDLAYRASVRDRIAAHSPPGRSVLCLGARIGTEVKAWIDSGYFALGVDLNPGPENKYVVVGDFHQLQFADGSVDVVFTNTLDHVYDPERFIGEISRVVKPEGVLWIDDLFWTTDRQPGDYESLYWSDPNGLISLAQGAGWALRMGRKFTTGPISGVEYLFQKGLS